MILYFFGVGFSLGCANLVFKIIVEDNERKFRIEIVEFFSKNFYIDDGLKFVKIVEEVIFFIEKSKLMCKEGGF